MRGCGFSLFLTSVLLPKRCDWRNYLPALAVADLSPFRSAFWLLPQDQGSACWAAEALPMKLRRWRGCQTCRLVWHDRVPRLRAPALRHPPELEV